MVIVIYLFIYFFDDTHVASPKTVCYVYISWEFRPVGGCGYVESRDVCM